MASAWRTTIQDLAKHVSPMTGEPWIDWRYLRFICSVIMAEIRDRPEGARIILNAPPRHGKSLAISQWLPTWFLEAFPAKRVLLASYSAELAAHWGRRVRDIFNTCPDLWTKVKPGEGASDRWETTHGGGMLTAGVGGSILGFGGHLLIIDDPTKNWQDAHSPTMRQHGRDWFDSTFYTRREPGAHIIVIMQRWHEEDLTGYLLREKRGDRWLHIKLPAIAEEDDVLGRAPGEPLCPERYSARELAAIKVAQGAKWWGLYQQRPLPAQGSIIRPTWLRYFDAFPTDGRQVLLSVDASFKEGIENSFVVIQAWGDRRANKYLLDQVREQMDFTPTLRALEGMIQRFPRCRARLVEDKANGPAIISSLRNKIPGIIPIEPKGSKEARLQSVQPMFEANNIHLPAHAPWLQDYINEVCTFPSSAFDDQVDATSQALIWMTEKEARAGGGFGGVIPH